MERNGRHLDSLTSLKAQCDSRNVAVSESVNLSSRNRFVLKSRAEFNQLYPQEMDDACDCLSLSSTNFIRTGLKTPA